MKRKRAGPGNHVVVFVVVLAMTLAVALLAAADAFGARGPRGTFYINQNATYTTTTTVSLDSAMTGATQMHFRNSGGSWTAWEAYAAHKSWTLQAGDGAKTVDAEFRDASLNTVSKSDSITLDTQPPTGSISINAGSVYTTSTAVTLRITSNGASQMMVSNSPTFSGAVWEAVAPSKAWTLVSGDGTKTVYVKFKDTAGNVSAVASDDVILDTQPPTGSININAGSVYTTSTAVTLSITSNGASQMMVSNSFTFSGASWETPASSRSWILASGEGTETVYAQFKDAAGNASTVVTDDVVLDTQAPTGSATINGGSAYTTTTATQLALSAADPVSGVQQMRISNDGTFDTEPWENYATSRAWVLEAGDGLKTVYVQFRDKAGNVSASATDTITLDTLAPSGTVTIDGGATYTTSTAANLDITSDRAVQMMISDDPAFAGASWEPTATSKSWNLPAGDGTKAVYVKFKNAAGTVSAPVSDTIVLDTQPPTGSATIDAGATYATSLAAVLSLSAMDARSGVDKMRVSNDGSFDTEPWENYTTSRAWSLDPGDGLKTVYVEYRDRAGNVSGAVTDTIVLDTLPPSGSVTIDGGAAYAASTAAGLSVTSDGATQMMISGNSAFTGASWEATASSKPWVLASGDGAKVVYVKFKDAAGNVSATFSDSIVLDTHASTGSVTIDTGATYATSANVTLTVSATDTGSDVGEICISNDGTFDTEPWESFATLKTWTLSGPDGTKTVYVKFKDLAGNVSATFSDVIVLDSNAPTGLVVIDGGALYATTTATTLSLSAADTVSGVESMRLSNDGDFDTEPWESYETSHGWLLESGDGTKTVSIEYRDRAGNVSGAVTDTIVLDTTAPSGSFAIDDDASQAGTMTVSLDSTVTDGVEMRFGNGDVWTDWEDYAAHRSWTLAAPDETKTVEAQYRDEAGNVLALSDGIRLETGPPSAPGGLAAARGDQRVNLSWSNPRGDFAATRVLRSTADYPSDPNPTGDQVTVYEGGSEEATDVSLVNGTQYFYAAFAMDDLSNWSVAATATATPGEPTVLLAAGRSASVAYGTRVNFTALLTSKGTTLTARDNVTLWRSSNGVAWSKDGKATYNAATSNYQASSTITAKTVFQLRYDGETMYQPSVSNRITLTCRAFLGRPWLVPSSPVRLRAFTVYGFLKPRHAGATRLYFYRYLRRKWRLMTYRNATNYSYLGYTRYKLAHRLLYSGRWCVKAYHSDGDHLATWSTPRYFAVK